MRCELELEQNSSALHVSLIDVNVFRVSTSLIIFHHSVSQCLSAY